MSCALDDLIAELDRLLEPERFRDYCPNGLQVPGRREVETVATAVSAHVKLFEYARDAGADLVLAHHGIFWGSGPGSIDVTLKRRLELLFECEMSLAAYHLPLDAHPTFGNNAILARELGGEKLVPFAQHEGEPIGFLAELPDIDADELFERVHVTTDRQPLVFASGPQRVGRIAVVTGAGAGYLDEAVRAGADAFITGEPAERVMAQASESAIHFVAAGHYATETFGVKALGNHLAERFSLRHVFLDVPNPV